MASFKQILNGNWICLSRCLICVQVGNISCDFSSKDLKDEMEILIGEKKKKTQYFHSRETGRLYGFCHWVDSGWGTDLTSHNPSQHMCVTISV